MFYKYSIFWISALLIYENGSGFPANLTISTSPYTISTYHSISPSSHLYMLVQQAERLPFRDDILKDFKFKEDYLIRWAADNDRADIIRETLLYEDFDFSAANNFALHRAISNDNLEIAEMLLQSNRLQNLDSSDYLSLAILRGYEPMTVLLLKYLDPAANDNQALRDAVRRGESRSVLLLLQQRARGVNASIERNILLRQSIARNDSNTMDVLMRDGSVIHAIDRDILRLVLEHPMVWNSFVHALRRFKRCEDTVDQDDEMSRNRSWFTVKENWHSDFLKAKLFDLANEDQRAALTELYRKSFDCSNQ